MKISKRRMAWLVIILIIVAGIGLNTLKARKGTGVKSSSIQKSVEILGGIDTGRRYYRQRFVAGDEGAQDKIALINIEGEITNSRSSVFYRRGMVDEWIDQLKQAERDENVKAIILNINSPGGPVIDADILYMKIRDLAKKKVVVALLDRVAASGGYYVACAANKIISHPLTLTGSIGVVMDYINLQGLLEKKLGVEMGVIKSGRYKDIGSPFRPMDTSERKMLQELVDAAHRRFVENISTSRRIPVKKLAPICDGRIYSGEQAKELGLVDELGTLDEAIEIARNLSGIKRAKVVEYYTPPLRLIDYIFGKMQENTKLTEIPRIPEPVLKYIWQPGMER